MQFPGRISHASAAAALLFMICCPLSFGQNAVLTGSVNQDLYRPSIITQNATLSQAVIAPSAPPLSARPLTSVRIPQTPRASVSRGPKIIYVDRPVIKEVYLKDNRTFFERHPKVKAASVGAGVGAGVGALTGLVTHRGVMRGALIGAGTGAGVGLVRSSVVMKRHPIVRNIATGSLIGLGIGGAASRGHTRPLQGAGIGAALGLGASLLNGEFR